MISLHILHMAGVEKKWFLLKWSNTSFSTLTHTYSVHILFFFSFSFPQSFFSLSFFLLFSSLSFYQFLVRPSCFFLKERGNKMEADCRDVYRSFFFQIDKYINRPMIVETAQVSIFFVLQNGYKKVLRNASTKFENLQCQSAYTNHVISCAM